MLPSFLTAFFFSCSTICASRAAGLVGGTEAHFFRLLVAIACLGVYAHIFGQGWMGAGMFFFFMSGVLGIGLGDFATFHALLRIGPSLAAVLVQCMGAPCAALVEWIWLGTTLTAQQMVGGGIILIGSTLSLLPQVLSKKGYARDRKHHWFFFSGVALALLSALTQSTGAVVTRKAFEVNALDGVFVNGMTAAYQRICGGTLFMVGVYALAWFLGKKKHGGGKKISRETWKTASPWIIGNALTGMVLGVSCFQWALKDTPTAVVLSIVALTPLIVIPLVWVINKEKPSVLAVVGGIIAVSGVMILLWV